MHTHTHAQLLSRVQLFASPWTIARRLLCPWGFSRQEYWSGLPFPPPGDLPNPGIEPRSPAWAGRFFTADPPGKPRIGVAEGEKKKRKGKENDHKLKRDKAKTKEKRHTFVTQINCF